MTIIHPIPDKQTVLAEWSADPAAPKHSLPTWLECRSCSPQTLSAYVTRVQILKPPNTLYVTRVQILQPQTHSLPTWLESDSAASNTLCLCDRSADLAAPKHSRPTWPECRSWSPQTLSTWPGCRSCSSQTLSAYVTGVQILQPPNTLCLRDRSIDPAPPNHSLPPTWPECRSCSPNHSLPTWQECRSCTPQPLSAAYVTGVQILQPPNTLCLRDRSIDPAPPNHSLPPTWPECRSCSPQTPSAYVTGV